MSAGRFPASNHGLWKEVAELARGLPVRLVKVESHQSAADAIAAGTLPVHHLANSVADKVAERAAELARLPMHERESVKFAEGVASAVRNRLAAAYIAATAAFLRSSKPLARAPKARLS